VLKWEILGLRALVEDLSDFIRRAGLFLGEAEGLL